MDPLSVTAGVAGLLSLSIQLVEISSKFKPATKAEQLYDFIFELNALADVLKRLKDFLDTQTDAPHFNNVSAFVATNTRFKIKLEVLLRKLQKKLTETSALKRAVDALIWPLNEKEHRETTRDIQRYTQVFHFALTIEGCSLLAKSSEDVENALQQQTQKLEETKGLCRAIPDLVAKLDSSLSQLSDILATVHALGDHSTQLGTISDGIAELRIAVDDQKRLQKLQQDEEDRKKVLVWLSPLLFEAKHRQISESRQSGTGQWFADHVSFQNWKNGLDARILWCSGIPGAGKTYMSSMVIDNLRGSAAATSPLTAFIYADYKDHLQQSALSFLSSITRQFAAQDPRVLELAKSRYNLKKASSTSDDVLPLTFNEQVALLKEISTQIHRFFLVVDAVDELPGVDERTCEDVRCELLEALSKLDCASLFFTSRPHITSNMYFPEASQIKIEASDADLRVFLEAKIDASKRLATFVSKDRRLKEEIVQGITAKASGMFLLARLQLEQVMMAIAPRQARTMLEKLSNKLSDVYHQTMDRIRHQPNAEAAIGLRAISWVARVRRPLTVSEFVQALSIEIDDQVLDESCLVDINIILEACAGLVHLQAASSDADLSNGPFFNEDTLHFTHHTMQEYLIEQHADMLSSSDSDIANTSLAYLCFKTFRSGVPSQRSNPFLAYAAAFWPAHAACVRDELRYDLITMLTSSRYPALSRNWLQYALRSVFGAGHRNIPPGFATAAVAMHGATTVLGFLLKSGLPIKVKFHSTWTPFWLAVQFGDQTYFRSFNGCNKSREIDIFSKLLDSHTEAFKESDHMDFDPPCDPPLISEVIQQGERWLLAKLLEKGWDPNLCYPGDAHLVRQPSHREYVLRSVLYDAIDFRQPALLQTLLDAGANVNQTLLVALRFKNHVAMKQLTKEGAILTGPHLVMELNLETQNLVEALIEEGLIANSQASCGASEKPFKIYVALEYPGFPKLRMDLGDFIYLYENKIATDHQVAIDLSLGRILVFLLSPHTETHITPEAIISALLGTLDGKFFKVFRELLRARLELKANMEPETVELLIKRALRAGMTEFPHQLKECAESAGLLGEFLLKESIIQGNLPIAKQLIQGQTRHQLPVGFQSPLMLAFKYQRKSIIEPLLNIGASVNTNMTRLALEWYIASEPVSNWFLYVQTRLSRVIRSRSAMDLYYSLHLKKPEVKFCYPFRWFTCDKLFLIYRLGTEEVLKILRVAMEQGLRPIDFDPTIAKMFKAVGGDEFKSWIPYTGDKELYDHLANDALLGSTAAGVDEDAFDIVRAAGKIASPIHDLPSLEPQVPTTADIEELRSWLEWDPEEHNALKGQDPTSAELPEADIHWQELLLQVMQKNPQ